MKNILLATDLAAETNRALGRAVKLASTLPAKLHILHVCPFYPSSKNKTQKIFLKQGLEGKIKNFLATFKGAKNLQTSFTVIEGGETFVEIINHAEKVKADLIVMGMHGKGKLLDMFVGTTIERIIRKGIRPVLMVRDKPHTAYKNVFVGTNFSAGSKRVFHVAIELAPKSIFHLVHAYGFSHIDLRDHMSWYTEDAIAKIASDKLEKFVKKNSKVLKKYKVEPQKLHLGWVRGETCSSLLREATKLKADLIAIGTHSHSSFRPYKLGGTARDILSNPPCDVLIAKGL